MQSNVINDIHHHHWWSILRNVIWSAVDLLISLTGYKFVSLYSLYCVMSTFHSNQSVSPYEAKLQAIVVITFFFRYWRVLFSIMYYWPLRSYYLYPLYKYLHLRWVIPNTKTELLALLLLDIVMLIAFLMILLILFPQVTEAI